MWPPDRLRLRLLAVVAGALLALGGSGGAHAHVGCVYPMKTLREAVRVDLGEGGALAVRGPTVFRPCGMEPLTTYEARVSFSGSKAVAFRIRARSLDGSRGGGPARRLLDIDKVVFVTDAAGQAPAGAAVLELEAEMVSRLPVGGAGLSDEEVEYLLVLEPLWLGAVPPGAFRLAGVLAAAVVAAFWCVYPRLLGAVTAAPPYAGRASKRAQE